MSDCFTQLGNTESAATLVERHIRPHWLRGVPRRMPTDARTHCRVAPSRPPQKPQRRGQSPSPDRAHSITGSNQTVDQVREPRGQQDTDQKHNEAQTPQISDLARTDFKHANAGTRAPVPGKRGAAWRARRGRSSAPPRRCGRGVTDRHSHIEQTNKQTTRKDLHIATHTLNKPTSQRASRTAIQNNEVNHAN